MFEFNNRIDAQRSILSCVNQLGWNEELFGLSKAAIERWIAANNVDPKGELAGLIFESASKLFFLANKSQEQVTEDYLVLSKEVYELTGRLKAVVNVLA